MAQFDFAQVLEWLGSTLPVSGKVGGFKQDSRAVVPGDLFFALKGEKVDGHEYLNEVAERGAVGAVVSKHYRGESFGLSLIRVEDVLASLQKLAKSVLARRSARVVGVTGSVGKTTTKEFIATLLEGKFRVGKTPGNANSQVSVPLSILNSEGDEEVVVVEMGMTQPREIEKLIAIAPPEICIITKIALAHVSFFSEGIVGIATAKAEILSHPLTKLGILNSQASAFSAMHNNSCLKMTYALEEEDGNSDFILCREGSLFYAKEKEGRTSPFPLPFTATHLCENFIGAAAVARGMGMSWSEIITQAQKLKVFMRRFEIIERDGIIFLNDSYNANYTSMKAALLNLPVPRAGKKRIAVLGSMKELGSYTEQMHYEVGKLALSHIDYLLCLGEECITMVEVFQKENRPVEHFLDLQLIKKRVFELAEEGDVVLLKGSNSKKLWQVLE
jgi:UDP-N-acetylmuramoyl-tripeptide--D-alanyl-D-alanine ligase